MFFIYTGDLWPAYTEHDYEREGDHECERGDCIGLGMSNLYESVYTKGGPERGWKLVRAESRSIASGATF